MGSQQFCLRWNNHQTNMVDVFDELLTDESFVDVTLACEGNSLKAHKLVLSACSPFFKVIFKENPCQHPIVILRDLKYEDLKSVLHFMYRGEVNVSQNQLSSLLKTAEVLKIKGLADANKSQHAAVFSQATAPESMNDDADMNNHSPSHQMHQSSDFNASPVSQQIQQTSDFNSSLAPQVHSPPSTKRTNENDKSQQNRRKRLQPRHINPMMSSPARMKTSSGRPSPVPIDISSEETLTIKQEDRNDSNVNISSNDQDNGEYRLITQSQRKSMSPPEMLPSLLDVASTDHHLSESQYSSSVPSDEEPSVSATQMFSISNRSAKGPTMVSTAKDFNDSLITSYDPGQGSTNDLKNEVSVINDWIPGPYIMRPECSAINEQQSIIYDKQSDNVSDYNDTTVKNQSDSMRKRGRPAGKYPDGNSCHICNNQYSNRASLIRHMSMHSSDRIKYDCTYCHKTFFWRTNLYNHRKKFHSGKP